MKKIILLAILLYVISSVSGFTVETSHALIMKIDSGTYTNALGESTSLYGIIEFITPTDLVRLYSTWLIINLNLFGDQIQVESYPELMDSSSYLCHNADGWVTINGVPQLGDAMWFFSFNAYYTAKSFVNIGWDGSGGGLYDRYVTGLTYTGLDIDMFAPTNEQIQIHASPVVPEPTTLILLGVGLAGIGLVAGRKMFNR